MKLTLTMIPICLITITQCLAQANSESLLKTANLKQYNLSIEYDSILYHKQLKDLQGYFIDEAQNFYDLASFTDKVFISYFDNKDLEAYAFNPSINKIKKSLSNLKTDFDYWDNRYSQSEVLTKTNYNEIKMNYLKTYNNLFEQLNSNCNSRDKCKEIKSIISDSQEHIKNTINELIKFLKL